MPIGVVPTGFRKQTNGGKGNGYLVDVGRIDSRNLHATPCRKIGSLAIGMLSPDQALFLNRSGKLAVDKECRGGIVPDCS